MMAWRKELGVGEVQVIGVLPLLNLGKKLFNCSAKEVGSEQPTTGGLGALPTMMFKPCHASLALPEVSFCSPLFL